MAERQACRLIDTGLGTARRSLALSAALIELRREERIGDLLRLHRFRPAAILGLHGDAERELDTGWCQEQGVEIARRPTGGGAVYMDPGILCWDLLLSTRRAGRDLPAMMARACAAVATALAACGIAARAEPPGAILTEAGKVGGVAGMADGPILLLQGTLIFAADAGALAASLRRPLATVAMLGEIPDAAAALTDALGAAFGLALNPSMTLECEKKRAETRYRQVYGRDDFVLLGGLEAPLGVGG